mmetsp:Transcript_24430/g.38530  ORF Transcript_24430/g.38530 Transcript_24430/m.38530 type:complete len:99 (-) Transcript_24430:503-799(-)
MGAVPSTEGGIPEIIHEEGALEMNEEDYTPENIVPEVCPEKEPRLKAPRTEVPGKKRRVQSTDRFVWNCRKFYQSESLFIESSKQAQQPATLSFEAAP